MKRYIELDHTELAQALKDYLVKHYSVQPVGYPILVKVEARRIDMPDDAIRAIRIEIKS